MKAFSHHGGGRHVFSEHRRFRRDPADHRHDGLLRRGFGYSPALTDFIVMVKGTSHMVITGPGVIKSVTGEDVDLEKLGGAKVHSEVTGQAHFVAETMPSASVHPETAELPAVEQLRGPPVMETGDDPSASTTPWNRSCRRFQEILRHARRGGARRRPRVLSGGVAAVCHNIIVGFARMEGGTVGIVANQPRIKAGCLDVDASDKAARFIRFCDCFNIPLINLVDVPGYFPGVTQEHAGIIRHGAKMLYAYSEADGAKITLALRKEYGGAVMGMCCVAWGGPDAGLADRAAGGTGHATAVDLIFRKEIQSAKIRRSTANRRSPRMTTSTPTLPCRFEHAGEHGHPARETRPELIRALRMLKNKERPRRPSDMVIYHSKKKIRIANFE